MKKFILILIVFILFFSCGSPHKTGNDGMIIGNSSLEFLPKESKNITDAGNGWVYFSLKGKNFLYKKYNAGQKGYSCITQIQ